MKVGQREGKVYLEVHNDELEKDSDYLETAQMLVAKEGLLKSVSTKKLFLAIKEKRGMPVDISDY